MASLGLIPLISCFLPAAETPRLTEQACRSICTPRHLPQHYTTLKHPPREGNSMKHQVGFQRWPPEQPHQFRKQELPTSPEDSLSDHVHGERRVLFFFKQEDRPPFSLPQSHFASQDTTGEGKQPCQGQPACLCASSGAGTRQGWFLL